MYFLPLEHNTQKVLIKDSDLSSTTQSFIILAYQVILLFCKAQKYDFDQFLIGSICINIYNNIVAPVPSYFRPRVSIVHHFAMRVSVKGELPVYQYWPSGNFIQKLRILYHLRFLSNLKSSKSIYDSFSVEASP